MNMDVLKCRVAVLEAYARRLATKDDIANVRKDIEGMKLWLVAITIGVGISAILMIVGAVGFGI